MEASEVKTFIGRNVVVISKKLSMSVVGYVEAVICDVLIIQGFCCWGINCSDVIEIKERL